MIAGVSHMCKLTIVESIATFADWFPKLHASSVDLELSKLSCNFKGLAIVTVRQCFSPDATSRVWTKHGLYHRGAVGHCWALLGTVGHIVTYKALWNSSSQEIHSRLHELDAGSAHLNCEARAASMVWNPGHLDLSWFDQVRPQSTEVLCRSKAMLEFRFRTYWYLLHTARSLGHLQPEVPEADKKGVSFFLRRDSNVMIMWCNVLRVLTPYLTLALLALCQGAETSSGSLSAESRGRWSAFLKGAFNIPTSSNRIF